jgi:hypothetical protein
MYVVWSSVNVCELFPWELTNYFCLLPQLLARSKRQSNSDISSLLTTFLFHAWWNRPQTQLHFWLQSCQIYIHNSTLSQIAILQGTVYKWFTIAGSNLYRSMSVMACYLINRTLNYEETFVRTYQHMFNYSTQNPSWVVRYLQRRKSALGHVCLSVGS